MYPRSALALAAASLILFASGAARAATIGAEVGISSISPCPSFCGGSGATFDSAFDGGEGSSSALLNFDNTATFGHGIGQGRAEFVGPDLLPRLRALADSEPNARVNVGATGYRLYSYSGPATTITLDVSLIGNAEGATASDASIRGTVALVLGSDTPHSTDPGTFLFEIVPGEPGLEQCGATFDMSIDVNVGIQTKNGSISCMVEDGDEFFVWSNLSASGTRDGTASAFESLVMSWADSSGISVVPEPGAALLLLGAGLAVARRRGTLA